MVHQRIERERIVITGLGIVAPNGIGKEEFQRNCFEGTPGIKPITLFNSSEYRCQFAGEIGDFQPAQYLGSKGLRNLDRTTLLALVAAKFAIEDARLEITDKNRSEIGVVLGSTMGSVHSISEFDKEGLREGPRFVNPAFFSNTVINSPASQIAIRFGLRSVNATISTGFSASLDAISYAVDMLRSGRVKVLLVGGVEELCIQTFLGFYKLGLLSCSLDGPQLIFAPFDQKHCGTVLGEGSSVFVLESLKEAQTRGATIYGEVLGYGTCFNAAALYRYDRSGESLSTAIQMGLEDSNLSPEAIDCVSASANGIKVCDLMEAKAINRVFGLHAQQIPVTAIKSLLGESFSAAGAFQIAIAIHMFAEQKVPPTINCEQVDPLCNLNHILGKAKCARVRRILINAVGPMGVSSALVIGNQEL